MKCNNCQHDNPIDASICEACGETLQDASTQPIELTSEPDLEGLDEIINNTPVQQAAQNDEEAKEEAINGTDGTDDKEMKFNIPKVSMPKIHISDETKQTILGALKESVTYFFYSLTHPSKTKYQVDGKSLGVIGLYSIIINWLFLYIVQRGIQQSFFMGFGAKVSSHGLYTFLCAILMALMFWLVGALLSGVASLIQKEKISIKHAMVDATHSMIVPMVLLLIATVISAFFFTIGFYCYSVVFVAYLMNIMMLFKNAQNYISYITVTIVISLVLYGMYKMSGLLMMHWRIGTMPIYDLVKNFNKDTFDFVVSMLFGGVGQGL